MLATWDEASMRAWKREASISAERVAVYGNLSLQFHFRIVGCPTASLGIPYFRKLLFTKYIFPITQKTNGVQKIDYIFGFNVEKYAKLNKWNILCYMGFYGIFKGFSMFIEN